MLQAILAAILVFAFFYVASRKRKMVPDRLQFAGEEWTRGDYPRSFSIDPTGTFLFSCNQRSDAITSFRVNKKTGALSFTGNYTPVGTPAILVFL